MLLSRNSCLPFLPFLFSLSLSLSCSSSHQVRFHPKPGYMSKQPDITNGMRSILVDWLVEVSDEFKLEAQTLHLAVTITDRFLSVMSVMRSKLQLVGTASMFIAAKFEEIYPPEIADFVYITDDTYHKGQVAELYNCTFVFFCIHMYACVVLIK